MISLEEELRLFEKKTIRVDDRPLNGLYEPMEIEAKDTSDHKIKNLIELSNIHYNDALDLIKDNNISRAIELMERSLEYNPKDIEVLNLMGLCHYLFCNFDKAILNWNKSFKVRAENNRAKYYLDILKSDRFKSFIEYYNLAIAYIDKFEYEDALELLLEINKTNKDLIEAYAIIGNCYYGLQDYGLARRYFDQALSRDKDNLKYLKYLNKINRNIPLDEATGKNSNWKYKVILASMALLILIGSIAFYLKYNKDVKKLSSQLETSKVENIDLKEKLEDKDKEDLPGSNPDDESKEDLNFEASEFEIFEEAMEDFSNEEYNKSIDKLQYLIDKGDNEDVIAESIYYAALSFENQREYDKAGEYYNSYIDKYSGKNYYDDSLYNYALMLHENGDIEGAKKLLNKLKREEPDSIFMNSKAKSILGD